MVGDYKKYSDTRNITFIGICTSTTATLKSMERQIKQYNLKPFANMLDAGGATRVGYHVPDNRPFWLVVLDGDGKFIYNSHRGWYWTGGSNKNKKVHHTQIEASQKKYPGILGIPEIPSDCKKIAHFYDLQQFYMLEVELRLTEKAGSSAGKRFAGDVRTKIDESRRFRVDQIAEIAKDDPIQAYREAESFVQAFPRAPEKKEVRELASELRKMDHVRKELKAEQAYHRILVPTMKKARNLSTFRRRITPLLASYLRAFGDTKYAEVARNAVDAHKEALARGN